jgi:hypothetical protein
MEQKIINLWREGYSARIAAYKLGMSYNQMRYLFGKLKLPGRYTRQGYPRVVLGGTPDIHVLADALLQRRSCQCRWPIGLHYCENEKVIGKPYCEKHLDKRRNKDYVMKVWR